MDLITTINHLPHEVLYMIMDSLVYPERIRCRLISKHFMHAASYVFRVVHFSSRARVTFFAEAIKKNPCIATHVQVIKVTTAAILRAINQTDIKRACVNVKEIEILNTQGKGTWAQHLLPYKRLQHAPTLLDVSNAKIVLDNFTQQLHSIRLGGKYLIEMSLEDICHLIQTIPNVKTIGLHYEFKEKHRDLDRDLPHSLTFKDVNTLLKLTPNMTRFELKNCEVADVSLLYHDRRLPTELLQHIRELTNVTRTKDLFDPISNLVHLQLRNIKVTYVTWFVQSILKGFSNLKTLEIQFARRDFMLESTSGIRWDTPSPQDWLGITLPASRLKKLALSDTDARLNIPLMLEALGEAGACLEDVALGRIGHGVTPWDIFSILSTHFVHTLEHLQLESLRIVGLNNVQNLSRLKTLSLNWQHNELDSNFHPLQIMQGLPELTKLTTGYSTNYARIKMNQTCTPIKNLTSVTLDRVVMSQGQLKQFFLPLVNLKEAIFRFCIFEYKDQHDRDIDLVLSEVFDNRPATGVRMEVVRSKFFDQIKEEERQLKKEDDEKAKEFHKARARLGANDDSNLPSHWTPRRYNLQVRSLSLEHLGLHDCRLRDMVGGISTARTIRNFEVVQDRRCGIHTCYDVDLAYHEKKHCNPHIIYNSKRVSEDTISYHFTHEFGGTTGKNNYLLSRPTFIISMFSLEKLSIRPNALMSVYFTGVDGNRLKHCDTAVKEEVERSESLEYAAASTQMNVIFSNRLQNIQPNESILCDISKHKLNREVEKMNEILTRALNDVTAAEANEGFTLDRSIFDSELFKVKSSRTRNTQIESNAERPRKRDKKTLPIRPF